MPSSCNLRKCMHGSDQELHSRRCRLGNREPKIMARSDDTQIGGIEGAIQNTQWTLILQARTADEAQRKAIQGELLKCYWRPIYCFIRRKGYSNEDAKDHTQGFFLSATLERDLFQKADRSKGRFRTYLLKALKNYLARTHRQRNAAKRSPPNRVLSLEDKEGFEMQVSSDCATPDEAFDVRWASDLLDRVIQAVETGCRRSGLQTHWDLFYARVLGPILEGTEAVPVPELCRRHGVAGETQASNMIVTVKRRFQIMFRDVLGQYVDSEKDLDDEIAHILQVLSKGRARN